MVETIPSGRSSQRPWTFLLEKDSGAERFIEAIGELRVKQKISAAYGDYSKMLRIIRMAARHINFHLQNIYRGNVYDLSTRTITDNNFIFQIRRTA